MIKALGNGPDGPVIIYGLSEENISRLKQGMPILVDNDELGLSIKVVITYGQDEDAILKDLQKVFGKSDTVVEDRRKK